MVGRSLLVSVLIMFVVVVFIVLWKCIECRRYLFSLFVVVLVTSRYCVFRFYEGLCKLSWNVICVMSLSDQVHLCSVVSPVRLRGCLPNLDCFRKRQREIFPCEVRTTRVF